MISILIIIYNCNYNVDIMQNLIYVQHKMESNKEKYMKQNNIVFT